MLGQESRKAREAMHVVSGKYRGLDVEVWIVGERGFPDAVARGNHTDPCFEGGRGRVIHVS